MSLVLEVSIESDFLPGLHLRCPARIAISDAVRPAHGGTERHRVKDSRLPGKVDLDPSPRPQTPHAATRPCAR